MLFLSRGCDFVRVVGVLTTNVCIALSRACDYVRLIGVLARENASLIAAHVRQQHEDTKDKK